MKKHLIRILIMLAVVGAIFYLNGGLKSYLKPSTVRAFGKLLVDFHVSPPSAPIFNINNMKPGDSDSKPVDVKNDANVSYKIAVKGKRIKGIGTNPVLDTGLNITIKQGSNIKYGPVSLFNFFSDSTQTNGIPLDIINPSQNISYGFIVDFPKTAGNEYQAKSVTFDLTFGTIIGQNVVINEVYYQVDSKHGLDSPKDSRDKTKNGINDEWIELYNPTNHDINLKGWILKDNSGAASKINSNKILPSESFILIAKDSSTWKYWNIQPKADKINLGTQLGDGLDNNGDFIILKDSTGKEIDRVSWNAGLTLGHSIERLAPGYDTDQSIDWTNKNPPTPGI